MRRAAQARPQAVWRSHEAKDILRNPILSAASTSRHNCKETERFKAFDYEDLIKSDKFKLDIVEDLQAAL